MDRDILYQKFLEDPKSVPSYELANISSKFEFDKTLSIDKNYYHTLFHILKDSLINLFN